MRGAHFGVYDYTALCGITAAHQHPRHLACDWAREMMRVSLAQTGVNLSDGSSNLLPIPPHVHRAWKQHFDDVTHSLVNGFYQGWDLHPAHLPTRYAAVYAFYLSARPAATARLSNFFTKAARAGAAFDDAATGQALVNFFARGLSSGAITRRRSDADRLDGVRAEERLLPEDSRRPLVLVTGPRISARETVETSGTATRCGVRAILSGVRGIPRRQRTRCALARPHAVCVADLPDIGRSILRSSRRT